MISVCMATYNGEKYIREQIYSILSQLSNNDELIISDDFSTDRTLSIIANFDDSRIVVYHHEPVDGTAFQKATANFANALIHAKGDYIFLSDQDDIWHEDKVAKCMEQLKSHCCVQHLRDMLTENSKVILPPKRRIPKYLLENIVFLPTCYSGCCLAFHRKLLNIALPIPKQIRTHDSWIGCLAFMTGDLVNIDCALMDYRVNENTVSYGKSKNSLFHKLRYRIVFLFCLLSRFYFNR